MVADREPVLHDGELLVVRWVVRHHGVLRAVVHSEHAVEVLEDEVVPGRVGQREVAERWSAGDQFRRHDLEFLPPVGRVQVLRGFVDGRVAVEEVLQPRADGDPGEGWVSCPVVAVGEVQEVSSQAVGIDAVNHGGVVHGGDDRAILGRPCQRVRSRGTVARHAGWEDPDASVRGHEPVH